MISKEELENFKENQDYINDQKKRIEEQMENLQKITATFNDMPKVQSQIYDKMAENLTKVLDIQNQVLESILRQEHKLIEILKEIDKLEPKYRNVIYKHYVEGKDLYLVSREMCYGYEWICRLNGQALQILKKS